MAKSTIGKDRPLTMEIIHRAHSYLDEQDYLVLSNDGLLGPLSSIYLDDECVRSLHKFIEDNWFKKDAV
jgi:hypothetical protein